MSVDEIRARQLAKQANIPLPTVDEVTRLRVENEQLKAELAKLKADNATRGRLTPAEIRCNLGEIMERYGISPAEELVRMATETNQQGVPLLSPDQRIKIFTELNQYVMPKLKSVETHGKIDHEITVNIRTFDPLLTAKPARTYQISGDQVKVLDQPKGTDAN